MGTVRGALQLPDMRRIEPGYGLSITGELAGTVGLMVYPLSTGGAALVAAYAASRTVAGAGVVLVLTGLTYCLRRDPACCAGSPGFARSSWWPTSPSDASAPSCSRAGDRSDRPLPLRARGMIGLC